MINASRPPQRYRVNWFVFITRLFLIAVIGVFLWVAIAPLSRIPAFSLGSNKEEYLSSEGEQIVVVCEGDTLWSLAKGVSRQGTDIRACVEEIMTLNGLDNPIIRIGSTLRVPVFVPDIIVTAHRTVPTRDNS